MEIECNCGASDWRQVLSDTYPDWKQTRNQTERTVYECAECGAQGRRFEDGTRGTVRFTGAMR